VLRRASHGSTGAVRRWRHQLVRPHRTPPEPCPHWPSDLGDRAWRGRARPRAGAEAPKPKRRPGHVQGRGGGPRAGAGDRGSKVRAETPASEPRPGQRTEGWGRGARGSRPAARESRQRVRRGTRIVPEGEGGYAVHENRARGSGRRSVRRSGLPERRGRGAQDGGRGPKSGAEAERRARGRGRGPGPGAWTVARCGGSSDLPATPRAPPRPLEPRPRRRRRRVRHGAPACTTPAPATTAHAPARARHNGSRQADPPYPAQATVPQTAPQGRATSDRATRPHHARPTPPRQAHTTKAAPRPLTPRHGRSRHAWPPTPWPPHALAGRGAAAGAFRSEGAPGRPRSARPSRPGRRRGSW
jgi:hypothetical protein